MSEVLKREVVESEKAEEARKKIARSAGKVLRARLVKQSKEPFGPEAEVEVGRDGNPTQV
jgi:hypothetical protein